mgnify:CR=1 FL=1
MTTPANPERRQYTKASASPQSDTRYASEEVLFWSNCTAAVASVRSSSAHTCAKLSFLPSTRAIKVAVETILKLITTWLR